MMSEHPIQGLMKTAMENIRDMVDVNTIVGEPVETPDGSVIMPISRVGFGFAAGGSEFAGDGDSLGVDARNASVALPFGGGSGGGVSITPIAFLVVGKQGVKIVPLDSQTHLIERLIDSAPQVFEKIQSMLTGGSAGTMSGGMGAGGGTGASGGMGAGGGMGASGGTGTGGAMGASAGAGAGGMNGTSGAMGGSGATGSASQAGGESCPPTGGKTYQ